MTPPKTLRRSSARDLPPSADRVVSSVTSTPAGAALPKRGDILRVQTYSGVVVRARIVSVDAVAEAWLAWGEVLPGHDADLRANGVPPCGPSDLLRIFSWQVIKEGNR